MNFSALELDSDVAAFRQEVGAFLLVLGPHPAKLLASQAFDGGGGQDRFGAAAHPYVQIDAGIGQARSNRRRHVAVANQTNAAARLSQGGNDVRVARAVQHHRHHILDAFVQPGGNDLQVGFQRGIQH